MAKVKPNIKVQDLLKELYTSVNYNLTSERFRSDKKRLWRCVDTWKIICHRALENEKDPVVINQIYAIMNSITYHIYEMEPEQAIKYIYTHLEILEGIDYDEYVR